MQETWMSGYMLISSAPVSKVVALVQKKKNAKRRAKRILVAINVVRSAAQLIEANPRLRAWSPDAV